MTHKQLVNAALLWLSQSKRCNPVFGERGSSRLKEIPDAIGFNSQGSVVVECKASLSDLKADRKKEHRNTAESLGNQRYYLMTEDLFQECQGHDFQGWGVVIYGKHFPTKQARGFGSGDFDSSVQAERDYLLSRVLQAQRFGRP